MSELGSPSYEKAHSVDSLGRDVDMPFSDYSRDADLISPDNSSGLTDKQIDKDFAEYESEYPRAGGSTVDLDSYYGDIEKSTREVQRAIADIDETETIIATRTGLIEQELTDATDMYLVDRAEQAVAIAASDKRRAVKTALIEGALEITGERPVGTTNPIDKLEDDGNGQAVTEGVRQLYMEGATLPNGESAAEVVATTVLSHEMQSEHYDADSKEAGWDSPERAQKLVEDYVTPGSKVLDIGIGTGQAVSGYAEKGATVIGLDRDESMLGAAESIVGENGTLRQADINKELPITDLKESVDVAQAIGVLEFAEDLPGVLDQVHESLKENGVFVFTSELVNPAQDTTSRYEDIGLTVHRHSVGEIQGLLERKGYKLLSHDAYDGYEREDGVVPYGIFLAQKQEVQAQAQRPQISTELDTALQYYYNGGSKEDIQQFVGVDPKEVTEYVRNLPEEEREFALEMRRRALGETAPASDSQDDSELSAIQLESMFVNGINEDETSLTNEQLNTWFKALPEDERQRLVSARQEVTEIREYVTQKEMTVEQNLETSAPELLKGRLPQDLAARIGSGYVIGLRQLGSFEANEAKEQLMADGGVDVSNLGLTQSFNVINDGDDAWTTKGTVIRGYYGVRGGGKFVIAIPTNEGIDPTVAYNSVPDMQQKLQSRSNPDHRAVNPKYVAGFIDAEGIFHPNENFMRSNEAKLSSESVPSSPSTDAESKERTNPYER